MSDQHTTTPAADARELADAIRDELNRHLINANEADMYHEHQYKSGYNKGLREAGVILTRCLRRGDFDKVIDAALTERVRSLEAENERLRGALRNLADNPCCECSTQITDCQIRRAQRALAVAKQE